MVDINHMRLQFARLVRHTENAKSGDDPIAFLDLAHCLRIWVEMKADVDQALASMRATPRFKHTARDRRFKEMLRDSGYVFAQLPTGVRIPGQGRIQGLAFTDRVLTNEEVESIRKIGSPSTGKTDLTFSEWLASEIIETTEQVDEQRRRLGISREMLIKRVANFLGASHPAGMESSSEHENRFDPHIRRLHEIRVLGGIPLTYYQLLEIAEHIIETLTSFVGST